MHRPYTYRAITLGLFGYCRNIDELVEAITSWAARAKSDDERCDRWNELRYAATLWPSHADTFRQLMNT